MSSPIHQPQQREPSPEERELYDAFPEARAEQPPPTSGQAGLVPDLDRLEREIASEQVRASEASLQPAFEIHPARLPGRPEAPARPRPPTRLRLSADEMDRLEREIALEQRRIRREFDPVVLPPPPEPVRVRRSFAPYAVAAGVACLAGIAVYAATGKMSLPESLVTASSDALTRVAAYTPRAAEPAPAVSAVRLVIEGAAIENGDVIPVGLKAEGPIDGAVAIVSGLVVGTVLSAGRPWGSTTWVVPAHELAGAHVRPPQGFVGTMDYTVALRLPDGTLADTQTMRLEWRDNAAAPGATPNAASPTTARRLDLEELAALLKRGQELFETGDLASARLLLRRAAEARDPRAALILAATYDPIVLKELGVYGAAPDAAMAQSWYEKAKEFGSREAPRRLELLRTGSR
ncbi:MAG TPA: hypothetical protein VIG34_01340 [Xanthobacteraceae bacterium]|jgi:hypothetical protein